WPRPAGYRARPVARVHPGHGGTDLLRVPLVGLAPLRRRGRARPVAHGNLPAVAIDLEVHRPPSVLVGLADGGERDDQRLARLEIHPDFLSRIQAIEICGAIEDGNVLVSA